MSGSYGTGGLVGTISKALNQGTGTVVNAYGIVADVQNISTGAITNSYTMYVPNPYVTHGSIANAYGLYIKNITSGTSANYSLYVEGSNSYFGGIRFTGDPSGTVQTTAWTGVLCGGDYSEAVNAVGGRQSYEPGDVLVLSDDDKGDVRKSQEPYSTMVAGIFATKPGVIGKRQNLVRDSDEVPMAMVGIVPTRVSAENGPIRRGDLLVTSSTWGYAMKGTDRGRMLGAVIGKAMEPLNSGIGIIQVLVTLQ